MRCQIAVFTLVVSLLSVSVFQVLRLFLAWSCSVFPWRVRTGLCSLPELETLHCRVTAPALPMIFAPPLCFGVCTCTASSSHLHCVLELSIKTICFSLAIGSWAFCTVTELKFEVFCRNCQEKKIKQAFVDLQLCALTFPFKTMFCREGRWLQPTAVMHE